RELIVAVQDQATVLTPLQGRKTGSQAGHHTGLPERRRIRRIQPHTPVVPHGRYAPAVRLHHHGTAPLIMDIRAGDRLWLSALHRLHEVTQILPRGWAGEDEPLAIRQPRGADMVNVVAGKRARISRTR